MNNTELLAAIDEVRHDVDRWDHNHGTRTYTATVGPYTFTVHPMAASWCWEVKHEQAGTLITHNADTAAEARRLALDYATLVEKEPSHA